MDIQALYSRRIEAASIAAARGDRSEAERLYTEALAMGREHFGATSPQLAVPLNELSRLYVHISAHARAEPLLKSLLEIRRAEGESHSGVATVLAALAAVRRGLADDAGAEDLYRRALAIREVVHAPDHMALVVVVEQLADTCAARAKFVEAQALFERALRVREQTMGAEHASVRALRMRIAEVARKAAPVIPVAPPANQLVFIYEPEKPVRRASVKRERSTTPPFSSMAVAAASIIAAPAHVAAPQPPAARELAAPSLALVTLMDIDAPVVSRAHDTRAETERATQRKPRVFAARADVVSDEPRKRARRFAYAATAMAGLAGALFVASAMTASEPPPAPAAVAEASPAVDIAPPPATVPVASVGAAAVAATARGDSARMSSSAPARMALTSTPVKSAAEVEKRPAEPALPVALPTIGEIAIPVTAFATADSAIRASTNQRDIYPDQPLSTARLKSPTVGDNRAETAPLLIGSVPQPRYPDGLRSQRVEVPWSCDSSSALMDR